MTTTESINVTAPLECEKRFLETRDIRLVTGWKAAHSFHSHLNHIPQRRPLQRAPRRRAPALQVQIPIAASRPCRLARFRVTAPQR